jgi:stage II sporulation protein M
MLGAVCRSRNDVVGPLTTALRIVPHGIFELPAVLVANADGLRLGVTALRRVSGRRSAPLRDLTRHALRRFAVIVLPLLVLAATIEAFLVPHLIRSLR